MSYTLTLEPAAAAWHGPQRLILKVAAEQITDVEYRIDLPVRSQSVGKLPFLEEVARSCPTCSQAHSLAFALAVESLFALEIPLRPLRLRLVAAELERAISHLATLEALFTLLGMIETVGGLAHVRAGVAQGMALLSGSEGGVLIVPGGLRQNLSEEQRAELRQIVIGMTQKLYRIADRVIDQRLLLARTVAVGTLSGSAATQFRLCGPLARASGVETDARLDAPYGAYQALSPQLIAQESGDVYARLVVLLLEALESLKLSDRALDNLPDGPAALDLPAEIPAGSGEAVVEAPRGALRYRVESDGATITHYQAFPAPQIDRLLSRTLLIQAAPDDAVLIALSTDPCSACQGLKDALLP